MISIDTYCIYIFTLIILKINNNNNLICMYVMHVCTFLFCPVLECNVM